MSVKKAKGKGKSTAKKAVAKAETTKAKTKGKDIVEIRENISALVKDSAEDIATSVIEVATRTGQLASAKYLFEAVGIYPAMEQTEAREIETTMAHQLLARMGLPLEPVVCDEDSETPATSWTQAAPMKAVEVKKNDPADEGSEKKPIPAEEAE